MKNFDKVKEKWTEKDLFSDNGFEIPFSIQICKIIKELKKSSCESVNACKECYKWLQQEHKEPILDDVEREYLSAVIKPFRGKIIHIRKEEIVKREFIKIVLIDDTLSLPYFKAGTMYKGMKLNKRYTLKELGL